MTQETGAPMTPFQELRRRLSTEHPAEVKHSPVSAVRAACAAADSVETEIKTMQLTGAVVQVGVVAVSADELAGRTFVVPQSPEGIGRVVDALTALPQVKLVGLIFCVADTATGAFEIWTRAFRPGIEYREALDCAVADHKKGGLKQ